MGKQKKIKSTAIYRCAERFEYVQETFPALLSRTSIKTAILVLINTHKKVRFDIETYCKEMLEENWVGESAVVNVPERLGNPGSINTGVKKGRQFWGSEFFFVCDEDVIAPNYVGDISWDAALVRMLEAGWKIAGHPCSKNRWKNGKEGEVGGVAGKKHNHLGGAYSSFTYRDWSAVGGVPDGNHLFGYDGPFQTKVNPDKDKIGYFIPRMLAEHIDLPDNPKSLRATKYKDWYKYMRPDQAAKFFKELKEEEDE